MHVNITYDDNFTELMLHLKAKYGQKLFDLDGIGSQLDIDKFSKGFFTNSSTTADVSVDSNSNVSTKDMIVYNTELPKPYFRMNAYYLIWKKLRQLYGHAEANRIIEMQLTGDFYINDFHGVSQPYSYHPYTKFIVKINNKLKNISMVELFSKLKNNVKILPDCEIISTEKLNIKILDKGNWVRLDRILRHRSHTDLVKITTPTGAVCIVTEDHPVILSDGSEKRADMVSVDDVLLYEVRPPEEVIDSYGIMLGDKNNLLDKNTISTLSWKNEWVYDVTTETGTFYSNGLTVHNCYNYSTYDIALNGLTMVNKIKSIAPKHLYSFKSQLEQFVVIASNSTLGACGLADLLIVMAYYVDKILETKSDAGFNFITEEDCWRYVKENLVSFIYTINQPSRASQSPFTNVSIFDDSFLNSLVPEYKFPDDKIPRIVTIKKIQELFIDTMNDELRRTPVTFPITTACFSVDCDGNVQDEAFLEMISEKNMEYGFINIYCGKTSTLSSCCRLRSDTNSEYFNSFGSGSVQIGSLGVVTVNLPRLAYRNKDNEEGFFAALEDVVEVVAKINNSKRHIIKRRIENGAQPLYSQGFMDINKQYSTCGLNGINEAITIMGYDVLHNGGVEFGLKMLDVINKTNDRLQKQYKAPHNCEQTPSENSSIKLANKDKMLGIDLGYNLYSNQFIPLTTKADLLDRIKLQGIFDKHFSGGSIAHLNIEERITEKEHIMELIRTCAKKGVIYFAINYNLQRCEDFHMTVGKNGICSVCGKPIEENFTRIVGFLTAVSNWHQVRREEDYPDRQFYSTI